MKPFRILFLCAVFGLPSVFAQSSSDATMQALLAEVRQLRLALERSAVVAPKIQMTLQRLQIQQDSVSRASRELDATRSQIAKVTEEQSGIAGEIKRGEEMTTQEHDPVRRKDIEGRVMAMKSVLDQQTTRTSELRGREVELSGRLRAEQAKLDELNDRLNVLEKQLESPQPKQP
jgi:hypothetical protein